MMKYIEGFTYILCSTEFHNKNRGNFKDAIAREVIGTSVLTRYNNKTYRIDDIDWDKTPQFKFSKDGADISLIQYFKKQWDLEIKDVEQPLLVHRAKQRTPTGEVRDFHIFVFYC